MSIATQVLIFAATALGPQHRRRPGRPARPGLHRLPRRRRLHRRDRCPIRRSPPSAGSHRSGSSSSLGACVAATLGLIIGAPTLRVSGDYLAIVTLAFGEIFRLAMDNLDGDNGPDLTNGPNGIPAHPRPGHRSGSTSARPTRSPGSPSAGSPTTTSCCWSLIGVRHHRLHPAQRQPDRPRLGGHPRGREGRRGHGRQRLRAQAASRSPAARSWPAWPARSRRTRTCR